jgi:anti-sigma-K factor RskA
MTTLTCDEVVDSLPAYALEALGEAERAAIQAHVRICPACRGVAAEYAGAAEALLLAAPAMTPPPALKQALMARLAPRPSGARAGLRARLGARFGARGLGYALALVVAGVALAVGLAQAAFWSTERAALLGRLERQEQALAALAGRDVQVVALAGRPAAQDASGDLRFVPDGTVGVLQARDLPPLPASQAYQLWLIYPDGTRDSGAVFSVPANGRATVVVVAPRPFSAYVRFGISIEPAGGSPAPTGPAALAS